LLALIELPLGGDDLSLARAAAELNYLEASSWTGFPQLGCWYVEVRGEDAKSLTYALAFALFIPNASYRPGLVPHVAFWLLQRLRWAREQQFPGIEDNPILEILEKAGRFRK
jgi:hypothetical protein